jgi:enoyl-[acyl-carrier-protein] reductase (NADH)
MEAVIRARAEETGVSFAEMERRYLDGTSLRRMVSGDDVAGMVLFLCSSLGRSVSGQSLGVCGNVESL